MKQGVSMPQSLYGAKYRPIVQSIRGSTVSLGDAYQMESRLFQFAESVNALGSPVTPSTA